MRILLKRGLESNRSATAVAEGEILFSKDTGRLFIGSGSGNFGGNEIRFNQLTSSFILATDVTASAGIMVQTSESLARFTLVSAGSISNADSIFSSKVSAGTPDSPSATLNGHYTAWQMQSFGGSTFSTSARMLMQTQGDHNEGSRPTNIIFSTVPSGSTTLQDRLKINGTGVQVTGSLSISGSITRTGPIITSPAITVAGSDTATQVLIQVGINQSDGGSAGARVVLIDAGTNGKRWDISNGGISAGNLTIRDSTDGINVVTISSSSVSITGSLGINGSVNSTAGAHFGALDSTPIGNFTPDVGSFTTLSANSGLRVTGSLLVTGSIQDTYGNVRAIPQNKQLTAYTLTVEDVGRHIYTTSSVTIPPSIFSTGDVSMIINSGSVSLPIITGSGVTFVLAGTLLTGNRTLGANGMASVTCVASGLFYLSGAGLT